MAARFLVLAAALVIVIAGIQAAEAILVPFLLAAFLAVICYPPLRRLHEWGLPTWLALLVVVTAAVLIGVLVAGVIGVSLTDFRERLPEYRDRIVLMEDRLLAWLEIHGITIDRKVEQLSFDPQRLLDLAGNLVGVLSTLFSNLVLILLLLVFLLTEAAVLPDKVASLPRAGPQAAERLHQILEHLRRYMSLKTLMCLLTAAAITAWLAVLKVDFPLLWGLLAFFFNFVPNIGSLLAAIPPVLLALVVNGPATAAIVAVGCLAINITIGSFIEPRVMGRGMGLSTVVVFLSLVFWGWVLGPVGMLLSVPLTMIVKIAMEADEHTQWIAVLLGSAPEAGEPQSLESRRGSGTSSAAGS